MQMSGSFSGSTDREKVLAVLTNEFKSAKEVSAQCGLKIYRVGPALTALFSAGQIDSKGDSSKGTSSHGMPVTVYRRKQPAAQPAPIC